MDIWLDEHAPQAGLAKVQLPTPMQLSAVTPLSSPTEQLLELGMAELHPGRPPVIALARARRDLHLAQQGVHFGDRKHPPCSHRPMAGDRRRDMIKLVAQTHRAAKLRD